LRAGLLSNPEVIETINRKFVSIWVIYDELITQAADGDRLARVLSVNHEYPLDFMFLTPNGQLITRLTSFKDLPSAHQAVAHPQRGGNSHFNVFMNRVKKHFGEE
jgi:hypothetical protein